MDHGRPPAAAALKEEEDPLGISSEGDRAKMTEEELLDMFPEGTHLFLSDKIYSTRTISMFVVQCIHGMHNFLSRTICANFSKRYREHSS
jgi:hypothetical protein